MKIKKDMSPLKHKEEAVIEKGSLAGGMVFVTSII